LHGYQKLHIDDCHFHLLQNKQLVLTNAHSLACNCTRKGYLWQKKLPCKTSTVEPVYSVAFIGGKNPNTRNEEV
jgi:hypothetical protein